MTLPEILREALRLAGDVHDDFVTITRITKQVRFVPDKQCELGYRLEQRVRSVVKPAWMPWIVFQGFEIEDALADWKLL
jgi:hypothetical protein